jgi:hypothetical protein
VVTTLETNEVRIKKEIFSFISRKWYSSFLPVFLTISINPRPAPPFSDN